MTLTDRRIDSAFFKRRKATSDTKRKIAGWAIWTCADPVFQHDYDRTVSLYVHEGTAVLTFTDGSKTSLEPGDFLTIGQGASATWAISTPIRNSYRYHDTFESAAHRTQHLSVIANAATGDLGAPC